MGLAFGLRFVLRVGVVDWIGLGGVLLFLGCLVVLLMGYFAVAG